MDKLHMSCLPSLKATFFPSILPFSLPSSLSLPSFLSFLLCFPSFFLPLSILFFPFFFSSFFLSLPSFLSLTIPFSFFLSLSFPSSFLPSSPSLYPFLSFPFFFCLPFSLSPSLPPSLPPCHHGALAPGMPRAADSLINSLLCGGWRGQGGHALAPVPTLTLPPER